MSDMRIPVSSASIRETPFFVGVRLRLQEVDCRIGSLSLAIAALRRRLRLHSLAFPFHQKHDAQRLKAAHHE